MTRTCPYCREEHEPCRPHSRAPRDPVPVPVPLPRVVRAEQLTICPCGPGQPIEAGRMMLEGGLHLWCGRLAGLAPSGTCG